MTDLRHQLEQIRSGTFTLGRELQEFEARGTSAYMATDPELQPRVGPAKRQLTALRQTEKR